MSTTQIKSYNSDNQAEVTSDHRLKVETSGSSTITGDVNLNGLTAFQTSEYSIGITAVQITPTPLAGRSSLSLKAVCSGSNIIWVGNSSSVTAGGATSGYPLFSGDSVQLDIVSSQAVWAISDGTGNFLYALEAGD